MNDIAKIRDDYIRHPSRAEPEIPALCDEIELLRKQHADLKTSLHAFASCVLTVEKHNTDEWMDWIAGTVNDVCEMLGTDDRFQYDGRGRLRRVK